MGNVIKNNMKIQYYQNFGKIVFIRFGNIYPYVHLLQLYQLYRHVM